MPISPKSAYSIYDDAGNSVKAERTAAIAGNAASTTVVKNAPGRLVNALVTAAGTSTATTIYDNNAGSGTILAVIPAATAVGTQITIDMPAANGITVVQGASSVGLTIGYS
jgi:hypothetical protein